MRYAPVNITTAVMLGLTIYLMIGRMRARPDASWPMFYYLFLILYHQALINRLNEYSVYAGVVLALFIRFEFLHSAFSIVLRACEMIVLTYFAWRFLELIQV